MSVFGSSADAVGAVRVGAGTVCPCGTGQAYAACCGPLHEGVASAESAVRLMRSRYAAYVVHDTAYLLRTWHPRTRPADLDATVGPAWQGLTVVATADGRECDSVGEVEFEARYEGGVLRERSQFVRRGGRWVYVEGHDCADAD